MSRHNVKQKGEVFHMVVERTRFEGIFEKFKKKSIDNSFLMQEKDIKPPSPSADSDREIPVGQRPLRATFLGLK